MAKIHRKHEKIKTKHNNENRVNMNNKLEQLNETFIHSFDISLILKWEKHGNKSQGTSNENYKRFI